MRTQTASATVTLQAKAGLPWLIFGAGIILLGLFGFLDMSRGETSIPIRTVWASLISPTDTMESNIVWSLRFPRAVIGLLAGGALAVAGALLQNATRNPLAEGSTLGINAGAFLALNIAAVFFPSLASAASVWVCLFGGAVAAAFAFGLAGGSKAPTVKLALAGMIVTMTLSSFTGAIQLFYEYETSGLFLWGSGSLIQIDWDKVAFIWPWVIAASLVTILASPKWDIMEMDEDTITSLGQKAGRIRLSGLLLAVALSALAVSTVGPIGFVGLVAPHLIRLLGIRKHRWLLPNCFVWGAVIVLLADTIAQQFVSSLGMVPVGAVTAIIGAPWLIWLAVRATKGKGRAGSSQGNSAGKLTTRLPYSVLLVLLLALFVVVAVLSLAFGGVRLPVQQVVQTLLGGGDELTRNILLQIRLPRTLVAIAAGMALAVSGILLQAVVRNPLADPSIIGVTSGAGAGAMLVMVALPGISIKFMPISALIGAIAAAALIYLLTKKSGLQPATVALVGIAVSAVASSIIQVLVIEAQLTVTTALAWLSGTTYARGWNELWQLLIWPVVLVPIALYLSYRLDVLQFSDETIAGLGLRIERNRLIAAAVGVALAAAAVSIVGTIGFVGLLAPHAAKMIAGHQHRKLIPLAMTIGGILLMIADVLGRSLLAPKEVPSGLVIALIGAPYILWLMWRSGKVKA